MIIYFLLIFLYIPCSNKKAIKNGIYNLITNKQYLFYNNRNLILSKNFKHPNTFFRIKIINKTLKDSFYNIEDLNKHLKLIHLKNNELYFNKTKSDLSLWRLIKIGENIYAIKNKNNCFIKIYKFKVLCDNIPIEKAAKFSIFRMFSEKKQNINSKDLKLLSKEPIDILIKYIDLRDPNLKRNEIHQIEKDYDNEELRYSIRSILMNIPWIRKIFILMPNKKIRYFKDYKYIKDKIVYVNDKDLLGYDSSNINAFLFRYWKMKKFGISDNIIIMDDDCFIGKKLKKSDFFYVKNGKVFPLIITSKFLKINKLTIEKNFEFYKTKAKNSKEEQNEDIFNFSKYLTFLFIFNLFNFSSMDNVFLPKFTHNAIPANLNDLKEIYYFAYNSEYKYPTLDCIYRIPGYLQFQIFILLYTFFKYDRKVQNIPYKYILINNSIITNYKFALFCINKDSGNYSYLNNYKSKITMEYLFPKPTPYEIIDFSLLNLSYIISYESAQKSKNYENILRLLRKKNCNYFEIFFVVVLFFIIYKKISIK